MNYLHLDQSSLAAITPAGCCQAFFILAAAGVLGTKALPRDLSTALLAYGARRSPGQSQTARTNGRGTKEQQSKETTPSTSLRGVLMNLIDNAQVPHGWFLHFYVVAISWSLFWALQYISRGAVMNALASRQAQAGGASMEIGQVYVAWALITIQGLRRLYESLFVSKPGKSPMLLVHWLLALAYYTFNIASVWIEGSGAIVESWESTPQSINFLTPKIVIGALLFFFASYKQAECHRHLASLKKYTLPDKGWFQYIICPHYTSECLIYVAMSLVTAPPGLLLNRTVVCGLVFAAVNIGITAQGTKKWYAEKFGSDKVAARWIMIPPVF